MQEYIFVAIIGLVFINIMVFTLFARLQSQLEMRGQYELLEQQMALQRNPSAGWRRLTPTCASCATI